MKKVVFIDDEKDIIELYQLILEDSKDFFYVFFSDAQKACDYLAQNSVDLIVCDETMEDLNGLEVLTKIRKSSANSEVLFYVASGNPDLNIPAYKDLNCVRFFQKPFDLEEILDMIKKDLV